MVGKPAKARELMDAGVRLQQKLGEKAGRACTSYDQAEVYAVLGNRTDMLKSLDAADRALDPKLQFLGHDPPFDRYRSDPDFIAIARRVSQPQ